MNGNSFEAAVILSILLIINGLLAVCTGIPGYAWGVALIPIWGSFIFLVIGIIMLIMLIRHWRKQKKTQVLNNDENAEAEAAQENLLADDAQQPLEDKDKNQP